MKYADFPFIGLLCSVLSASTENCPDPSLLPPTSVYTQAVITARMMEGLDFYGCYITRAAYKCEGAKIKKIPYKGDDASGSIVRGFYFHEDTLNFMLDMDSYTYTIKLNQTRQTYLITSSGERIPSSRPCVGKLDKTGTISNVTISINSFYDGMPKIYLLPRKLLTQTILTNCPYHNGYCYDENEARYLFWRVASDLTDLKDKLNGYAAAVVPDAQVYTMSTAPLLQFLLLRQDLNYVAVELVKESSYSINPIFTQWQTDHQVNVSFHRSITVDNVTFEYTELEPLELNISGSREEAFNRMRARCNLLQLQQMFEDTLINRNHHFLIFVIYMGCCFLYTVFNVIVNYSTMRRLGGTRKKILACALCHATTNRYLCQRQREGQDDMNAQLVMMSTKMDAQIKNLEHLTEIVEAVLRRKKPSEDTYDYVRVGKYVAARECSEFLGDKSNGATPTDNHYDKWIRLNEIKSPKLNK